MALKPIEILITAKDNASSVFDSLNNKLKVIGVAILGYFGVSAFVGAVQGAGDFEAALSRVQAATGGTKEELALLRKAAEESGVNSTHAAGALENLAKAGLSAKEAIGALPAVINLAKAGDIDLAHASEVVTAAVMGMGLKFSETARVVDVLVMGANETKTSVKGMAEALSYAAPVANSMGLSLESVVAIIGQFAQAGIDASRAGTALNSILSQFNDPASKFRQELAAAGITTGNFETALHQLAKAGPAGAKAIQAVGLEAGPALLAMLNRGMPALDALTAKLKEAEGAAAAAAKVMETNLNGSLTSLESAWKYVKDTLATPVLPVITGAVNDLTAALRGAVQDGTVGKFGEALAAGFQSGIKWAKDFLAQVNFTQISADLRAFADKTSEVFTKIGEYASTAGNTVKLVYGVMSAGTNVVLSGVYLIGEAFAGVASNIQSGLALLYEGLAKITFGQLSAAYKQAAEEVKVSAGATWAAAEELGVKSQTAFEQAAQGAQLARDGFAGLSAAAASAAPALVATADKIKEINEALQGTPPAAKEAAKAAEEAAKATAAAFAGLGITSQASLKMAADSARIFYNQIKSDGTSTAMDIANAFKASADKAIAANNGIAPSWVAAEAAAHSYQVKVDGTGKTTVTAMQDAAKAIKTVEDAYRQLGLKTPEELNKVAEANKSAWDKIKDESSAGTATLKAAFGAYSDAALAAAGDVGSEQRLVTQELLTTEAAAKGLTVTFDATGKAIVTSMGEGRDAVRGHGDQVDGLARSYRGVGDAAESASERAVSALERQNAAIERANAAAEKAVELENKRLNRDKEGFTTGKDGQRIVAGTDLGTLTGVAAFLKAAGVDDDKAARKLALEFSDGQGNIDYIGNAGQKKYGGDTLSMALLKAAETYTFGADKNGNNAKTPSTIPAPAAPAATYITNITLPSGGGTKTVRMLDADSQSVVNDIVRQLALARGTAS